MSCICDGEWRRIIDECGSDIGSLFIDAGGGMFTFSGVLYADDDYYYAMMDYGGDVMLFPCELTLSQYGFTKQYTM